MRGPRITELDIERFTEGDCHILAKVLHALTGLPIFTFHIDEEPSLHAFVMDENDGTVIDVKGARPVDEVFNEWQWADPDGVIPVPELDWGAETRRGSWRRARTIAPLLIT